MKNTNFTVTFKKDECFAVKCHNWQYLGIKSGLNERVVFIFRWSYLARVIITHWFFTEYEVLATILYEVGRVGLTMTKTSHHWLFCTNEQYKTHKTQHLFDLRKLYSLVVLIMLFSFFLFPHLFCYFKIWIKKTTTLNCLKK